MDEARAGRGYHAAGRRSWDRRHLAGKRRPPFLGPPASCRQTEAAVPGTAGILPASGGRLSAHAQPAVPGPPARARTCRRRLRPGRPHAKGWPYRSRYATSARGLRSFLPRPSGVAG